MAATEPNHSKASHPAELRRLLVSLALTQRLAAATTALALSAALVSCKSGGSSTTVLSGAGSTFIYPVMTRWIADYSHAHQGLQVNYQSIGSGGGIEQVRNQTVDFGASDAPLDNQKLAAMQPVVQIPETAGPVCVTYNLPQLAQPLQLSPEALAAAHPRLDEPASDHRHRCASRRRLGHKQYLHHLPVSGLPRVEDQGGCGQFRAVAGWPGWQGLRRRSRPASPIPWRHRLR